MKWLIPVDGSAQSLHAVEQAILLAATMKQVPQLRLLNVQWNVATVNVKLLFDQQVIDDYQREQGLQALQSARALLDAAQLPYQYHISIGRPAEAILQYATAQEVSLILMGAQGKEGLAQWLIGSVAERVLRLSAVPVMVVR
ncbi:universal stress protein [Ferrigenium sp. UT5]|uniref:universal stress protein n=1 Tax=Ferrigenium sp. UT5 TaxID=3242105 RepID=UPI003554338F